MQVYCIEITRFGEYDIVQRLLFTNRPTQYQFLKAVRQQDNHSGWIDSLVKSIKSGFFDPMQWDIYEVRKVEEDLAVRWFVEELIENTKENENEHSLDEGEDDEHD